MRRTNDRRNPGTLTDAKGSRQVLSQRQPASTYEHLRIVGLYRIVQDAPLGKDGVTVAETHCVCGSALEYQHSIDVFVSDGQG
jgi:hypothetical protein